MLDAGDTTDDTWVDTSSPEVAAPRPTQPAPRARRGLRTGVGIALLAVGLGAVGFSVLGGDDEPAERPVGRLVATDLGTGSEGAGDDQAQGGEDTPATTAADGTATTVAAGQPVLGEPQWPSATAGRPAALGPQGGPPPADPGDLEDGFYLWQDFNGWHLFQVGGTDADQVTITGDDAVSKAAPTGGTPRIEQAGNTVIFARGSASERVVGMDFNPGYFAKTLVVAVEGDLRLHVGARRYTVGDFYGIQYSAAST